MPYIKSEDRTQAYFDPCTPGELNFKLTEIVIDYAARHNLSYQTINDIVGALEGAKLEFYRRVAAPYENQKIYDNGDVYPPELTGA